MKTNTNKYFSWILNTDSNTNKTIRQSNKIINNYINEDILNIDAVNVVHNIIRKYYNDYSCGCNCFYKRGERGLQGLQGETGATGLQGVTGPSGEDGDDGKTG